MNGFHENYLFHPSSHKKKHDDIRSTQRSIFSANMSHNEHFRFPPLCAHSTNKRKSKLLIWGRQNDKFRANSHAWSQAMLKSKSILMRSGIFEGYSFDAQSKKSSIRLQRFNLCATRRRHTKFLYIFQMNELMMLMIKIV